MTTETTTIERPLQQLSGQTSLLDDIVLATNLEPDNEAYAITRSGVQALITQLVEPGRETVKVSKAMLDDMIAEIDRKLSRQVDEILHHADFQKLESAWRSLAFLVDRTDFRENNKIDLLNATKEELLDDFDDAPEVAKTAIYKIVYSAEYGQFGGKPYAGMIGNYQFGHGPQDMKLLKNMAAVAGMAHAPFVAAVAPQFFGCDDYTTLPNLKDISSILEGPQYAKWRSFRESEDARYVGLTLPRFLLRLPYGEETSPVKSFDYRESVTSSHHLYCWGNAAFAFATRLTESFANFRWCANIIGPQSGGTVHDLPLHQYQAMGEIQTKIPTEVLVSERREFELAEEGFITLTMRKGSDNAAFFSANSVQKPKFFGNSKEGKDAELNHKLGLQLPYVFIVSRLAHYLKVIQRENIGTWKERGDLENELNLWIRQYVSDMDNPMPGVRSRRPLRQAQVTVDEVPGEAGWYRVGLQVTPHFKYMGAYFTLSSWRRNSDGASQKEEAAMAMPAHLTVTGEKQGKIDGSCDMQGREGTILVYGMNHDISIPRSSTDGLATGKRVHGPLTITKEYDKSSPKLYQALCTGEHLKNVTLKWYRITKQGTEEHYFTHVLEDAIVVNIKPSMPVTLLAANDPYRHMEEVSFTYKKIKWTWEPNGIEAEDSWAVPK